MAADYRFRLTMARFNIFRHRGLRSNSQAVSQAAETDKLLTSPTSEAPCITAVY